MRTHNGDAGAEQGAATLALASSDVRFIPLPPSFNARPYTMYNYIPAFGFPIYHGELVPCPPLCESRPREMSRAPPPSPGKELWRFANDSVRTGRVVRERLLENWRTALSEAEKSLYPGTNTGFHV